MPAPSMRREHAEGELDRGGACVALPAEPARPTIVSPSHAPIQRVPAVECRCGAGRASRPRSPRSGRDPSSPARARSRAPRRPRTPRPSGVPSVLGHGHRTDVDAHRSLLTCGSGQPPRLARERIERARAIRVRAAGANGDAPILDYARRQRARESEGWDVYLKSLTLKGFKSFAQPTTFAFEPGVTCIVGPNGSGKSNVVDALAWVMGEQGAKTLRGGKMEDVIFAGTATRGPLGRAEVQPHDRQRRRRAADRVQRGHDLAARSSATARASTRSTARPAACSTCRSSSATPGLGREMHVIVGQGQLDAVLHASAEDRRGFIEEAAGILKHRRRKEKTLRKLDAMQANLTRLSDLAGEIRRQLKPLGRQAEVAREAATIAAVVRDARARLLADEVVGLRRALDGARPQRAGAPHRAPGAAGAARAARRRGSSGSRRPSSATTSTPPGRRRLALESRAGAPARRSTRSPASASRCSAPRREPTDAAPERHARDDRRGAPPGSTRSPTASAARHPRLEAATAATRAARDELDVVDEGHRRAERARLRARHASSRSSPGRPTGRAPSSPRCGGEVLRHANALEAARVPGATAPRPNSPASRPRPSPATARRPISTRRTSSRRPPCSRPRARSSASARSSTARARAGRPRRAHRGALARPRPEGRLRRARRRGRRRRARACSPRRCRSNPGYEPAIAAALGSLADAVLVDDRAAAFRALEHAEHGELGRVDLALAGRRIDASRRPPAVAGLDSRRRRRDGAGRRARAARRGPRRRRPRGRPRRRVRRSPARRARSRSSRRTAPSSAATSSGAAPAASRAASSSPPSATAAGERLDEVRALIERSRFELAEQRTILERSKEQAKRALAALREFDAAARRSAPSS